MLGYMAVQISLFLSFSQPYIYSEQTLQRAIDAPLTMHKLGEQSAYVLSRNINFPEAN